MELAYNGGSKQQIALNIPNTSPGSEQIVQGRLSDHCQHSQITPL